MKAAVYYGLKDVRLEEVEAPRVRDGEILVKVYVCGICATDVKTVVRGHPLIKPPAVLGHEVTGEIVKTGKNVTGHKKGDRVVIAPYVPCSACYYCLHEQYTLCSRLFEGTLVPGGFAEFVKVSSNIVEKGILEIPGNVSYEEAALTEPLACCLHGMEECKVKVCDSVAIVGDGPIGLMHLQLANLMGAGKTIVSGQLDERLKVARELGADVTVNETMEDPVKKVIQETGDRGADVVIVAVGSLLAAEQGIRLARKGGVVNLFGGYPAGSELKIDPNLIHYSELTITGTFGFSHTNFSKALQLIGTKKFDANRLITHKFNLDEILTAIDISANRKGLKVLLII
ncbi:zinc-dependent dehydrogenase [Candidatus Bathyarchaeota archaeon]|nr:zinc-dependent dehydrogenase [Candidatus Bathyarchaeota archaeon]